MRTVAVIALLMPASALADDPPVFVWKADDALTYRVSQTTTVDELTIDEGHTVGCAIRLSALSSLV